MPSRAISFTAASRMRARALARAAALDCSTPRTLLGRWHERTAARARFRRRRPDPARGRCRAGTPHRRRRRGDPARGARTPRLRRASSRGARRAGVVARGVVPGRGAVRPLHQRALLARAERVQRARVRHAGADRALSQARAARRAARRLRGDRGARRLGPFRDRDDGHARRRRLADRRREVVRHLWRHRRRLHRHGEDSRADAVPDRRGGGGNLGRRRPAVHAHVSPRPPDAALRRRARRRGRGDRRRRRRRRAAAGVVRRGAARDRGARRRRDAAADRGDDRVGDRPRAGRRADHRSPGRRVPAGGLGGGRRRRPAARPGGRAAGRFRRRPEARAREGVDGEAVRLRGREPLRRPRASDLRRPRLYTCQRRRALLARAARGPHLGGHQRDPAADHRPRAREARGGASVVVTNINGDRPPLSSLLAPRSIAIVGASERAGSYGGEAMLNLARFGYPGRVYPVNPRRPIVHGFDAYASLEDLPEAPDAVVVAIPEPEEVVELAAAMGCGGAIVFAAQTDEPRLAAAGLPLCGPNGNGIVSVPDRVAMWGDVIVPREAGPVALISQSGNVAVNALASRRGLRLHTVISCGNSAVLDAADFLAAIAERDGVRSVALYLEDDGDGPRWCTALERCAHAGIGLAVLKAGASRAGAAAAEAHTGAIAGDQRIVRAFFEEAGAAWAEDPHDLLELAKALSVRRPAGRPGRGGVDAAAGGGGADAAAGPGGVDAAPAGDATPARGVAVMTCSGGDSAVAADIAADLGLDLPELAPATLDRLRRTLPDAATAANPLDYTALLWGDPIALQELMLALGEDPAVGQVLVLYDDAGAGDDGWASVLGAVQAAGINSPTPVALASTLPELLDDETALKMQSSGMAAIAGLRSGIRAVKAMLSPPPDPRRIRAMAAQRRATGSRWLEEHEAKQILRGAGIPVPDGRVTDDPVSAWRELDGPVAIKRLGLRHKAANGGVKLNLDDEDAVANAFPGERVLVERMAPPGQELIVSIRRDGLTPVLVVGLGGIHAEALDRADIQPLPATRVPRAIEDIAAKLAELPFALIELNPVIVHQDGAIAVDALALEED